jgi:hypothetical protein
MTTNSFSQMTPKTQIEYLKKTAILIHRIFKGDLTVSLYWSKDLIYEVISPKSQTKNVEIKCYNRFDYLHT